MQEQTSQNVSSGVSGYRYTHLNVCCSAGMKTPLAVDPPETKKSASLSESFFARAPAVSLVVGWMRAADERRFCQLAPRDALLRICLQMRTKRTRLTNHFSFSCSCNARRRRRASYLLMSAM